MEFTMQTLIIMVVILIMALVLIGLVSQWGSGGKGLMEEFFKSFAG